MKIRTETETPKVLRMSIVRETEDGDFYDCVVEYNSDMSNETLKIVDDKDQEIWIPIEYIPLLKKIFYHFDSQLTAEIAEAKATP